MNGICRLPIIFFSLSRRSPLSSVRNCHDVRLFISFYPHQFMLCFFSSSQKFYIYISSFTRFCQLNVLGQQYWRFCNPQLFFRTTWLSFMPKIIEKINVLILFQGLSESKATSFLENEKKLGFDIMNEVHAIFVQNVYSQYIIHLAHDCIPLKYFVCERRNKALILRRIATIPSQDLC